MHYKNSVYSGMNHLIQLVYFWFKLDSICLESEKIILSKFSVWICFIRNSSTWLQKHATVLTVKVDLIAYLVDSLFYSP